MAICCALFPGSAGSCRAKGPTGPTRPAGQSASKKQPCLLNVAMKSVSVIFNIQTSFIIAFLFRAFEEVTVCRGQRAIRSVLSTSFTWNDLLHREKGVFLFFCIRMHLPHLHFKVQCVTSKVFFLAFFFQGTAGEIGPPGQQGNPGMQVLEFILSQRRSTVNHQAHTTVPRARPACSRKASFSRMQPLACMRSVTTQPLSQSSPHHATLNLIDALLLVQGLPGPQGPIGVPGEKVGRMSFHLI